jgi:hypothetical protein
MEIQSGAEESFTHFQMVITVIHKLLNQPGPQKMQNIIFL